MKLATAFVVGSAITGIGIFLLTVKGAEWCRWVFLFPAALLATLIPHPNIGTPEHPMYEGTPLDVPAAVVGLVISALMNIAIAYYVLPRLRKLVK